MATNVRCMDELLKKLNQFPDVIEKNLAAAGKEAVQDVILPTRGLKTYPPETAANHPPTPYYIRGRGTETAHGNEGNSEKAGTQFYTRSESYKTYVGNRASYARYLFARDTQARAMARIGWRTLEDVIEEKMPEIMDVYTNWTAKTLKDIGL